MVCQLDGVDWGQHKVISSASSRPAGKALNISRALAWMGTKSIAAGLWGREDYEQMAKAMQSLKSSVKVKMTAVEGSTRRNITVVDTVNNREMHLRAVSQLASKKALRKLEADLQATVNRLRRAQSSRNSVCVFAGAMLEKQLLGDVVRIISCCRWSGVKIAVDTSWDALREIVNSASIWLIKPNVEELRELLGEQIRDNAADLAKAGRKLLDRVEVVLISRGKKGAIVVTKKGMWQGQACTPPTFLPAAPTRVGRRGGRRKQEGWCAGRRRVLSTVGCGDYLLAGFLKGLKDKSDVGFALKTAIKVATARAWGWAEKMAWEDAEKSIEVSLRERE
jgi:fructose-1-phosphate kinase PfkB-like protein